MGGSAAPGCQPKIPQADGRLRDECLNETLFTSLAHARSILAAWKHDYNTVRPHSKLGGRTPTEIAGQRGWGHAPSPVGITSTIKAEDFAPEQYQSGVRVTIQGCTSFVA